MAKETKEKDCEYRTYQFRIKNNNSLFSYCDEMCFNSKNLYNIGNFYIRQAYSGLKKETALRYENQVFVINNINDNIEALNNIKIATFEKRKNYKNSKLKDKPSLFSHITKDNPFVSNMLLDGVFKLIEQVDYRSLPAQTNQAVLKLLNQDWKSFFEALKEYKINPCKFKGRPKMPHYAKKDSRKVAIFTNQSCKLKTITKKNKTLSYLIFPKTKLVLNLGEFQLKSNKLKEVRIVPGSNFYTVEVITAVPKSIVKEDSSRIISIDLGVNNFATIASNVGLNPIIIKGGILKAKNQFYNKLRTKLYSVLRLGKNPKEGQFTSRRLNNLDIKRHSFIKDYFHKASRIIINYCIKNQIDTIVIGKNKGWKNNITMRKDAKQNFSSIPYNLFIDILTYKAHEIGVKVIVSEESYTSKASFIDNDFIPTYGVNDNKATFSGKRICRGMYKSKKGTLINADVNGAYNILRKVFPMAFGNKSLRDSGVVNAPTSLSVA